MILLGDINISSDSLVEIVRKEDIVNTKSNNVVSFNYDMSLMKYCNENNVSYAVKVTNINELIYSNLLNAKYILVEKDLSCKAQKIADDYMYDSKVIVKINSTNELEWVVSNTIDGAILI